MGPAQEKEPVLKKHVGLIHSENKFSLLQRKICNILLFNALNNIDEDTHEISIRQLCSLISYKSNDISLIKQSLKRLMSIVMEWNLLDDTKYLNDKDLPTDLISWNASTLLAGASITRGVVRYSYSPQIKSVLSSVEIYGRINLFVQAKFNSSYALVLYENCVRFRTIHQTPWFSLKLFRALMGVPADSYDSFKELKRNVITPAMTEINQKSDINVDIEYKRVGRQITSLKFLIAENNNYKPQFKRLEKTKETSEPTSKAASITEVLQTEFHVEEKQIESILKLYEEPYILDKIQLVRNQKNVANKIAYLISALKNDYQATSTLKNAQPNTSLEKTDNYLRESREVSKIADLQKKYRTYKFSIYKAWLDQHPTTATIHAQFNSYIEDNVGVTHFYRKYGLEEPVAQPLAVFFINFLEKEYGGDLPKCLSLEDFVTAEQEQPVTTES